jgi:hypothetical protein
VANETRGYYLVALLMPDGRVWTAGSEIEYWLGDVEQRTAEPKLALEAYEPVYYGVQNAAQVVGAPTLILYGKPFRFQVEVAGGDAAVGRVELMRF